MLRKSMFALATAFAAVLMMGTQSFTGAQGSGGGDAVTAITASYVDPATNRINSLTLSSVATSKVVGGDPINNGQLTIVTSQYRITATTYAVNHDSSYYTYTFHTGTTASTDYRSTCTRVSTTGPLSFSTGTFDGQIIVPIVNGAPVASGTTAVLSYTIGGTTTYLTTTTPEALKNVSIPVLP